MAADGTATHPTHPHAPAAAVPAQSRRRVRLSPTDRIVRQVQAIDAWVAARREREQALHVPGLTRDERMDVAREVEVLRRTHDAIKGRCARGLDAEVGPMSWPGPTAVIAHRHAWFVDKLALLLGGHGVTVLVCTDNGAEALGAVVAEPDLADTLRGAADSVFLRHHPPAVVADELVALCLTTAGGSSRT